MLFLTGAFHEANQPSPNLPTLQKHCLHRLQTNTTPRKKKKNIFFKKKKKLTHPSSHPKAFQTNQALRYVKALSLRKDVGHPEPGAGHQGATKTSASQRKSSAVQTKSPKGATNLNDFKGVPLKSICIRIYCNYKPTFKKNRNKHRPINSPPCGLLRVPDLPAASDQNH